MDEHKPLTPEQLDDIRHGAGPAEQPATSGLYEDRTRIDLAASLHMAAGELTAVRQYLRARLEAYTERVPQHATAATVALTRGHYGDAATHCRLALEAAQLRDELRAVLAVTE